MVAGGGFGAEESEWRLVDAVSADSEVADRFAEVGGEVLLPGLAVAHLMHWVKLSPKLLTRRGHPAWLITRSLPVAAVAVRARAEPTPSATSEGLGT